MNTSETVTTPALHPKTKILVGGLANALAAKLLESQQKIIAGGRGDGTEWAKSDWEEECNLSLHRHVRKGDPRDVAAYCAFMWHHGWRIHDIPSADIGTPCLGGFYAGKLFIDGESHALILAPKAEGEFVDVQWSGSATNVPDATSYADGMANTLAMAEAGSELANRVMSLRIGGFGDWHLPSRLVSLVLFGELYASGKLPESERFNPELYWTSTQRAGGPGWAWVQYFYDGYQGTTRKSTRWPARAVRRSPI